MSFHISVICASVANSPIIPLSTQNVSRLPLWLTTVGLQTKTAHGLVLSLTKNDVLKKSKGEAGGGQRGGGGGGLEFAERA